MYRASGWVLRYGLSEKGGMGKDVLREGESFWFGSGWFDRPNQDTKIPPTANNGNNSQRLPRVIPGRLFIPYLSHQSRSLAGFHVALLQFDGNRSESPDPKWHGWQCDS